jgi:c-di-GMP-binding flagellar brake protein YcgR
MSTKINSSQEIKKFLEFGMRLSVTIKFGPKDEYNLQSNLIGLKENQFLILDLGQKSVEDLITRKTSNVGVVIRGIKDTGFGHIIAFKSNIIAVTSRPTWLMFVRIPYNFETKPIRANQRFKLNQPLIVTENDNKHNALLMDLSTSGCGIYFDQAVGFKKESEIIIAPKLKHFPEQIPRCKVASIKRFNGGFLVGIKFEDEIKIEDELKYEILDLTLNN